MIQLVSSRGRIQTEVCNNSKASALNYYMFLESFFLNIKSQLGAARLHQVMLLE